MTRALVDRIADAVLYEGYMLYPYRPSIKNRQRWTFGCLFPEAYCRAAGGGDASSNQTECLVHGTSATLFGARVRFLHLTARLIGAIDPYLSDWTEGTEPRSRPVESLQVGDQVIHAWQDAEEREVRLGELTLGELLAHKREQAFKFPSGRTSEPLRQATGEIIGILTRDRQAIAGSIEVSAVGVAKDLFRVKLRVSCRTPLGEADALSRDAALLRSLISTHAILKVGDGEFVSLRDPPECWHKAAVSCQNIGSWPVLVAGERRNDTMLAGPIILEDYPQIAPESPGDFFDGTEIDEMLTLRIMTLTESEKAAMANVDDRAAALLARTEASAREQLRGLHGTVRAHRTPSGEPAHG